MRTPYLTPLLAGLLLSFAGISAGRSEEAPVLRLLTITELAATAGGHFVTRAEINGSGIMVLVDTGASAVALSYEDAQNVGLRPNSLDFVVPVATANGIANAARVKLDRVEIDNIKVDDVDALVLPEGALRGTLLGMTFLGRLESFKVENGILYLRD